MNSYNNYRKVSILKLIHSSKEEITFITIINLPYNASFSI